MSGGAGVAGTLTEARIYEEQGHREQALAIITAILARDANNKEARDALLRLSGAKVRRSGVNEQMLEFLREAKSTAQMNEFRRWLINI